MKRVLSSASPGARPCASALGLVWVAAVSMALPGCSSVRPPTFEPVSAGVVSQTAEGALARFVIDGRNRNQEPMPLRRADYSLMIAGREVFRGTRSPEVTLPTFGVQSFELPAVLPAGVADGAAQVPYRITGTVSYLEPGTLAEALFDSEVRVPTAPIELSGTLDLFADR